MCKKGLALAHILFVQMWRTEAAEKERNDRIRNYVAIIAANQWISGIPFYAVTE